MSDAFLDQCPACHWILDSQGFFLQVYGDTSLLLGQPREKLEGRSAVEVLSPEQASQWEQRLRRVFDGEVLRLRERRADSVWYITLFPIRLDSVVRYAGGFARDISAWSAADRELRQAVLGVLNSQEYQRNTMSRFLHDSVAQNLSALGLRLDLVRMDLEVAQPEISARIAEIQQILEVTMQAVRDYSYELNPSAVERSGLRTALGLLVDRARGRFAGTVRLNTDASVTLDVRISSAMFQIAKEALENSIQHASCSAIEIAIKSTRTGPVLEVHDNGKGFDPGDEAGGRGLGLLSMEHCAAEAGLDLSISSDRANGTVVRVSVPAAV
ncbi:MAG TPA: ATP-binding protein [Bryobacteraceae bacterium]|nr:ATP-binding protein [Bryobacteraceae bacterium]